MSLKINNYREQRGSLCANVSVFASVSVCARVFVSVLLCFFVNMQAGCEGGENTATFLFALACDLYVCVSFALVSLTGRAVSVGI